MWFFQKCFFQREGEALCCRDLQLYHKSHEFWKFHWNFSSRSKDISIFLFKFSYVHQFFFWHFLVTKKLMMSLSFAMNLLVLLEIWRGGQTDTPSWKKLPSKSLTLFELKATDVWSRRFIKYAGNERLFLSANFTVFGLTQKNTFSLWSQQKQYRFF